MSEPMLTRSRLRAPVAEVHRALTDPAALRTWLAEHAEVELPHRYEFWGRYTPAGDTANQRLLHADERNLRFAWTIEGTETTVDIGLQEDGPECTVLTLSQTGLPAFDDMVAQHGTLSLVYTFWALSIANLADYLEGRELTGRCDFSSAELREEFLIGAEPHAVFDSLLDPEKFAAWFGAKIELEPEVGGRWSMGGFEHDPAPAKIVELEQDRTFSIAWPDGEVHTWQLADSGGKTRLTFVQSGFDRNEPPYGPWMGWLSGFAELRRYHELPDWQQMWLEVRMDGLPDGLITIN